MGERRFLMGTTPTLVGYPRLRPGALVQGVPTSPKAKVATHTTPLPAAFVACGSDATAAAVDGAVSVGAEVLTVEAVFDEDYDVTEARAAVSAVLQGFGYAAGTANTQAAAWITGGDPPEPASTAGFDNIVENDAGFPAAFNVATGRAVTADDYVAISAAFLAVTTPTPVWVRGRQYLIGSAGDVHVVESKSVGASLTLRLADPLPDGIADGATVNGFALTRALTTDESAEPGEGIVQWQAVVDGETIEWTDSFRIVRRIPKATLTPGRLLLLEPTMTSLQLPTDATHEKVIAGAWERLQLILERNQVFDEDVVSDEALVPLHAAQCVLLIVEKDPRYDRAFVEDLRQSFRNLQDSTFNRKSYDEQGQLVAVTPRVTGVREDRGRGIRVGR